jgi:hypothetical protein
LSTSFLPVAVRIALAARLLGFRLEQERAVDDDGFAGLEPRQDLNLAADVAPAADLADLIQTFFARHEDDPGRSDALHRRAGHGDDGPSAFADGDHTRRGHTWTQPRRVSAHGQANGNRARFGVDLTADARYRGGERLARQRGKRHPRLRSQPNACRVTLEGLHDDPHVREVRDLEERLRRIHLLAKDGGALDDGSANGRTQSER